MTAPTKNHFNHIRMFARAFWSWAQLLVSRQKRICNFWLHKSTRPCACHNIPYFTTWQHGIRFEESVDFWYIRPFHSILYKMTIIIETFTSVQCTLISITHCVALSKGGRKRKNRYLRFSLFYVCRGMKMRLSLPNALGKYLLRHFWFFNIFSYEYHFFIVQAKQKDHQR